MKQSLRKAVKKSALGLAVGVAVGVMSLGAQAQYSNIYSIGDSLSDVGTFAEFLGVGANQARYTSTNVALPNNIWTQNLASYYGLTSTRAYSSRVADSSALDLVSTGNNFAVGGAMTTLYTGNTSTGAAGAAAADTYTTAVKSAADQITDLLARGTLDPNALYTVFIGGNDFFAASGATSAAANAAGQTAFGTSLATSLFTLNALITPTVTTNALIAATPAGAVGSGLWLAAFGGSVGVATGVNLADGGANQAAFGAGLVAASTAATTAGTAAATTQTSVSAAAMTLAGTQTAAQIARLTNAGAKNVIVLTLPNAGLTPGIVGTVNQTPATIWASSYNAGLAAGLAGNNRVLLVETERLVKYLLANTATFGINNPYTTPPSCSASFPGGPVGANGSLNCPTGGTAAANDLTVDGFHFTTLTHKLLGDWIYGTLNSATRVGALASVPMGRSGAAWRSIDGRMREFQNFSYQGKGFFFTADHAPEKIDGTSVSPSLDGAGTTGTLGFEAALSDTTFWGVTFGYAQNDFDLGGNAGDVEYDEYALSMFLSKKFGQNWYANLIGTMAWLDYDTTRNLPIGPALIRQNGETKAFQYGFKTQVGYNFRSGSIVHGPLASLAYENVTVKGYEEDPTGIQPLVFGDQERAQLRSRLGWQVASEYDLGGMMFRPYAQLSYDYQHLKDKRGYTVGFVGTGSAMTVDSENETGGYGYLAVGGTAKLSKDWSLGVGATTTFSQPGIDSNYSLSVTLSSAL